MDGRRKGTLVSSDSLEVDGLPYIPVEADDCDQLLNQINVSGDRYQWEFPGERKR